MRWIRFYVILQTKSWYLHYKPNYTIDASEQLFCVTLTYCVSNFTRSCDLFVIFLTNFLQISWNNFLWCFHISGIPFLDCYKWQVLINFGFNKVNQFTCLLIGFLIARLIVINIAPLTVLFCNYILVFMQIVCWFGMINQ